MTSPLADHRAQRAHLLMIPLAALFAIHPLAVNGCSCGHDFNFHLVNWMEAARQFSQGHLHPHWAYSPAFNAGEPRFVFYPPISWCLGALLGLLLTHLPGVSQPAGWDALPIVFTWFALCASGFAMHRLARAFTSANAALLAGVLYLVNPYILFTAYERTAYGELLAAAWMPFLLLAILRQNITISRVAIPVALLWLTNAPAAVMGSYALAFLAGLRIIFELRASRRQQALQTALKTIAGTALGLGLAAFYIIPAAFERRFVQIKMAMIQDMRVDHNFLFEHTGTSTDARLHDSVLHTASVIAVLILITTAVALTLLLIRKKNNETAQSAFSLTALILLTAAIAFLLIPISGPIWQHAPEVEFLQFPWRLLAILAPVCALAIATLLGGRRWNSATTTATAAILVVALTLPAYHVFRQRCYPEDTPREQFDQFRSNGGVDPTDEYTPLTGDNDVLRMTNPPYWIASSATAVAPRTAPPGPAPRHLSLNLPKAGFLVLNLRDYPAWHVVRNGVIESTRKKRLDGLIALPIPAGSSTIDIDYGHTADEIVGDAVTALAFVILLWLRKLRQPENAAAEASL